MAANSPILLRNGTVFVPNAEGTVIPLLNHSLLVEDNRISKIGKDLTAPSLLTKVIDCTDKIVSPGFIDTHHHLWQSQVKGRHADHTLIEYIPTENMQAFNYTPTDLFWGQLAGCLEALDAGTTMVVDHAHMNYSPRHNTVAIAATASSGIRSVFGYSFGARVKSCVSSLTIDPCITPVWAVDQAIQLAETGPFGDGRVQIGLAFDALFLPKDVVVDLFSRFRRAGMKLITSHYARGAVLGQTSILKTLDKYDLLGSDILISHATNMTNADAERITRHGVSLSSTPETELQMGLGYPLRGRQNQVLIQQDKAPKHQRTTAQDVFLLGTIKGARAVKMEADIGSLEEGKLADIVIFDGLSPAMICAADQDPIAAIVFHSSARDIKTVIVDGRIRKSKSQLTPVDLDMSSGVLELTKTRVEWSDMAKKLRSSRKRIQAKALEPFHAQLITSLQLFKSTERTLSDKAKLNVVMEVISTLEPT